MLRNRLLTGLAIASTMLVGCETSPELRPAGASWILSGNEKIDPELYAITATTYANAGKGAANKCEEARQKAAIILPLIRKNASITIRSFSKAFEAAVKSDNKLATLSTVAGNNQKVLW